MPDFKVTFRGDLGNLAQFDAAIRNSAVSSQRAFQNANANILGSIGKITGAYEKIKDQPGLFVKKQGAMADALNNTFRQTGEVIRRFTKDYQVLQDKAGNFQVKPIFDESYIGSFNKARGNLDLYNDALKRNVANEKELLRVRRNYAVTTARNQTTVATNEVARQAVEGARSRDPQIALAQHTVGAIKAQQREVADAITSLQRQHKGGVTQLRLVEQQLAQKLVVANQELAAANLQYDQEINRLRALDDKAIASQQAADARLSRRERAIFRRKGFRDIEAAANVTPPIQSDLARVLNESEQLRRKLIQGGLGGGAAYGSLDFQRALANQEAQVSSYTRNLRTGLRTVQGEFRDMHGTLNNFTVDLDDQGKVIGRWGGQLGGAGSILRQTVRDFQKVIEWTVATTVVFGALASVVGQLQNINELNTLLARFSITAQTSAQETAGFFDDLTQVAIATATPLKEIVTVADDIALATRTAGDSTDEWKQKIVDLTTAVGIFTNLTGKDTVAAADQLSAAFKQLDIGPGELVTVLNKVTAVAGGQANAIADIVQSISGLAEAAKAAGFSVDDMIGAVQVLSQVTNKTSAEVATAFKNLFGSVSSVGSEKILKQFGIAVRDSTGGVRDFLDIYRDIRRALDQGVIPQNRLPDVLRGIAGGPRRAPDAAALLQNIGRIDEVIERSAGATNEALVANAKILDTNQAKIIQFQNAIDAAVFKEFGDAVKNLTSLLADFGTAFANVLGGIDPHIVTTVVQLGLLTTAILTFGKVIGLIARGLGIQGAINSLKSLTTAYRGVGIEAKQAAADAALFTETGLLTRTGQPLRVPNTPIGSTPLGRFDPKGFLKNNKGKIALAGGLVAGAAGGIAAGGGANEIGTLLAGIGGVATFIPGLQAVGVAALVAGTAISLFSENIDDLLGRTDDAKVNTAALSQEVYNLTQALQATQSEANQYAESQKSALTTIKQLQGNTKRTAEEQLMLTSATNDYVESTLGLAAANREAAASFDEILLKLGGAEGKYGVFADSLRSAGLDPDNPELKKLQQALATDILKNTGQAIYAGAAAQFAEAFRQSIGSDITGRFGFVQSTRGKKRIEGNQTLDLSRLVNEPNLLRQLFNFDASGALRGQLAPGAIPANELSLKYVQSAVQQAVEQFQKGEGTFTAEDIDRMVTAVTELSKTVSSFTQNAAALAQTSALVQSKVLTGAFTGAQGQAATSQLNLAGQLNQAIGAGGGTLGLSDRGREIAETYGIVSGQVEKAIALVKEFGDASAAGTELGSSKLVEMATLILQLTGQYDALRAGGQEALEAGIIRWLKDAGVSQEILDELAKQYNSTLAETAARSEALIEAMNTAKQSARETFADRSLDLLIAENSGQFEDNAKGLAILKDQNREAYQTTVQLIDAIGQLSEGSFVDLNNQLANVIGLQGQYISQAELNALSTMESADAAKFLAEKQSELSGLLVENAIKAGVNAEGINKIKDAVIRLIGAIVAIPDYKQVIIDFKTRIQHPGTAGPTSIGTAAAQITALEQQQQQGTQKQTSIINDIIRQINKIMSSGSGSSLGSLPKPASVSSGRSGSAYNPPGLLDIPEEILQQSNAQALIRQAIANAKNLQSKVPGATAANKGEIVELLDGTKRILETRGVGEEFLRRAMDELRDEIKRQNDMLSKADTIRRIRVGGGDFSAIANVPINSKSGVSVGGANGPISVALDVNGTVFSPAQLQIFADMVAASLKRQLAS